MEGGGRIEKIYAQLYISILFTSHFHYSMLYFPQLESQAVMKSFSVAVLTLFSLLLAFQPFLSFPFLSLPFQPKVSLSVSQDPLCASHSLLILVLLSGKRKEEEGGREKQGEKGKEDQVMVQVFSRFTVVDFSSSCFVVS